MSKAKEIMTVNPVTCLETDSVYKAVEVMYKHNTGVVPIVDEENCCSGIVTDRDICLKVILEKREPEQTMIKDVMSWNLMTCHPEDDIDDVLLKMERRQIKRIPVIDDDEHCAGIISEHDIVSRYKIPEQIVEFSARLHS
jgi:CBS domain-containing protein